MWQVPHHPPTLLNRIFGLNLSPFLGQAHCLDCTFLVSLFSGLEPGHKKVLPPIPRPCCHICPLPPIPTNPPAPSLSLFPCPNLFTFLLCTLTLFFLLCCILGFAARFFCLPEGPVAPLNLQQVPPRPPNPPPIHFCPNLCLFLCQAKSPGLKLFSLFFREFATRTKKGAAPYPLPPLLSSVCSAPYPHQPSCTTIVPIPLP